MSDEQPAGDKPAKPATLRLTGLSRADRFRMATAVSEVIAERRRQIAVEGYTLMHDDYEHAAGELALAAVAYSLWDVEILHEPGCHDLAARFWPFPAALNPKTPRRNLVRAAALLIAEIERRDRLAAVEAALEPPLPLNKAVSPVSIGDVEGMLR